MGNVLEELLDLEKIEENIFRGDSENVGVQSVFGGQVLGQALMAAWRTVEDDRNVHSLHAYFLRPGDMAVPIIYDVDRIRDGNSFNTRRVVAIQHGRAIFHLSASFHKEEKGFDHQIEMPDVKGPENLLSELDLRKQVVDKIPENFRHTFFRKWPIDIRPVNPIDPFNPEIRQPEDNVWFRATGKLSDDTIIHRAVLAFASDFGLLRTAMLPHGITFVSKNIQIASLDHAMWFHRKFRMDEWLLYSKDGPNASGALGYARGNIFTRDGTLVASVAQEGLIREWPE
ncbi:MAG: acyl-CoA thioesterase II [Desulfobacterales bacterium]|nr:acyl-CoA thioesterase II [Desulfobacteraceae bacterium]MBT4363031.1 acyl-CoA thioesterase II [Desulfobacteraceae bacterium]MBT7084590.1 acyl-CoA thioesterase II [Desulfobacterales bacterium]MBT7697660.1 acyl-CoA thioesterase II [Desulfobacterales bacterium]